MCIAQKTLKSMPSTTPDMNQDNDDLDDLSFTPKSGAISPASSPSMHDRPTLNSATTDETYHFDPSPIINSSEQSSSLLVFFFDNLYQFRSYYSRSTTR